jgi:hypothetical protein
MAALNRKLPSAPLDSRHKVEVAIAAQKCQRMLAAQGCNPNIIRWNGFADLLEFQPDLGVLVRSLPVNIEHGYGVNPFSKPFLVRLMLPRLGNPKPILSYDNDGNRDPFRSGDDVLK